MSCHYPEQTIFNKKEVILEKANTNEFQKESAQAHTHTKFKKMFPSLMSLLECSTYFCHKFVIYLGKIRNQVLGGSKRWTNSFGRWHFPNPTPQLLELGFWPSPEGRLRPGLCSLCISSIFSARTTEIIYIRFTFCSWQHIVISYALYHLFFLNK